MNPPSVSGKSRDRWLPPLFALCPRGVGIRATFPKILCLHVVISSFPAPLCGCLLWCITRLRLLSVLRGWFRVSVRCHNSYGTSFTIAAADEKHLPLRVRMTFGYPIFSLVHKRSEVWRSACKVEPIRPPWTASEGHTGWIWCTSNQIMTKNHRGLTSLTQVLMDLCPACNQELFFTCLN